MSREFELKYRCDSQALSAIRDAYGDFAPIAMETTYYDTEDLKLAFHHWTLRKRLENGVAVCTFKSPGENGGRNEWEVECDSILPGIMALCQKGAPWELMRATAGGVRPFCGAKFTRLAKELTLEDGTQVELALDEGILTGGANQQRFAEVEVELKEGSEDSAVLFARLLAAQYALTPEPEAKVVRARKLAFL